MSPSNNAPSTEDDELCVKRPALTIETRNSNYHYTKPEHPGFTEALKTTASSLCKCNPLVWIKSRIPILDWLPKYSPRSSLMGDIISGCTVAIMHIPQGMGYALLAGLPAVCGLYMAFFPVLMYAILGTSRHNSMGSMSIVCMMAGKVVSELATTESSTSYVPGDVSFNTTDGSPQYTPQQVAAALALAVGLWQVLLGLLQLGVLSVFLSDMLVKGFTTGAAVHVITSQTKYIFGISVPRHTGPLKVIYTVKDIILNLPNSNVATSITSAITMLILAVTNEHIKPRIKKKTPLPFPIEFFAIVIGTAISYAVDFQGKYDMRVIGYVPTGLPLPSVVPASVIPYVVVDGFVIAIVAYTISLSMAKIFGKKNDYDIDATQELYGQGLHNVFGSFFQCAPSAACLSRSLLQESVGGVTQVTSFVCCTLILLILLFIGPLFETLPNCVLSSLIVVALKGMFLQLYDLKARWELSRIDAIIWLATFLGVVIIDIDYGLLLGIIMSVVVLLIRNQSPPVAKLGYIPNTDLYLELEKYSSAIEVPNMCIFQFGGALHFANLEYFQHSLYQKSGLDPHQIKKSKKKNIKKGDNKLESGETSSPDQNVSVLILELSRMSSLDSSAANFLLQLYKDYKEVGISLAFVALPDVAMNTLEQCGCLKTIEVIHFFHSTHDAITKMSKELISLNKKRVKPLEIGNENIGNPTLTIIMSNGKTSELPSENISTRF
ncbi:unnamed protein product [Meganyctiphanes norvegica]|uniref:STAS domain-containing protein n=1 Tax=Meganyctiphanes norvegica TaxID=48144 RepID=A0AAV2SB45_MEGNR